MMLKKGKILIEILYPNLPLIGGAIDSRSEGDVKDPCMIDEKWLSTCFVLVLGFSKRAFWWLITERKLGFPGPLQPHCSNNVSVDLIDVFTSARCVQCAESEYDELNSVFPAHPHQETTDWILGVLGPLFVSHPADSWGVFWFCTLCEAAFDKNCREKNAKKEYSLGRRLSWRDESERERERERERVKEKDRRGEGKRKGYPSPLKVF